MLPSLQSIRDVLLSGSSNLSFCGLKRRAHLIRRFTYPPFLVESFLKQLIALYVQKGYDDAECKKIHGSLIQVVNSACVLVYPLRLHFH